MLKRGSIVDRFRPIMDQYEEIYRTIHKDPELSLQEVKTAKLTADNLTHLGYDVTEGIGGHGVVGVLKNGQGKTLLLRAELDALPVEEKTGLDYASTKTMRDTDGNDRPVMHACGHDMHIATLLAAAALLQAARLHWASMLVVLFQPNEERNGGAKAMVDDGLYDRVISIPDIILGQHVVSLKTGVIAIRSGPILTMPKARSAPSRRRGRGRNPPGCHPPASFGRGRDTRRHLVHEP